MTPLRRAIACLTVLSPLLLWSCSDADVVGPEDDPTFEALEGLGASVVLEEVPGFHFLAPLADGSPKIEGEFNPNFQPELRVCEIEGTPNATPGCENNPVTTLFEPGGAAVSATDEQYVWNWDTDTGNSPKFNTNRYYQLQVAVGDVVIGSLILDPQNPNGPGQTEYPDIVYAFRVGETIPVKVFIGVELLCDTSDPEVLECITSQLVGTQGGLFVLDGSGIVNPDPNGTPPILATRIPDGWAPPGVTDFLLTLERLAVNVVDGGCAIGLDVLRIGDQCFRVSKSISEDLLKDATISICLDRSAIAFADGTALTEGQKRALEMVRFDEQTGQYEVLPGAADDCTVAVQQSLQAEGVALQSGLMTTLDDGSDDDGPATEVGIRLGGLSSSFSDFTFILRGGVLDVNDVDGSVRGPADGNEVPVTFRVVNRVLIDGVVVEVPVPDATLQILSADGAVTDGGTAVTEITTDSDGFVSVLWTLVDGALGQQNLVIGSFGLPISDLPSPGIIELDRDTLTVQVLGDPAGFTGVTPVDPVPGTVNEVADQPLSVTVVDGAAEAQALPGVTIEWFGDGLVLQECDQNGENCTSAQSEQQCVDLTADPATCETQTVYLTTTDENGTSQVFWQFGKTAGTQTVTARVAGTNITTTFSGSAEPGAPAFIDVSQTTTTGFVGETVGVSVTEVRDGFGNTIEVAPLTWEIVAGSGSITGDAQTAAGTASGTWTLGFGTNEARVVSGDAVGSFTAIVGACTDGFGKADIDGVETGDEWACANERSVSVNLGGGATAGVLKTMNDGTNAYFLIRVQQGTGSDLNSLRIDFDSDVTPGASALDDVLVFDPVTSTATDGYLSARCVNRSQSTCFETDPVAQQVDADVLNDGTWTTYEVSHPLVTGEREDIDASSGQPIGFFFTLFNGNGAKGNTQVPGFRDYTLFFQAVTPGS